MAVAILALVISLGAVAAGAGYVRTAHAMRMWATTRGTVVARAVVLVPGLTSREGRWGRGGGYQPQVTYTYDVDGTTHTSDRWSYAAQGLKHSVAEWELARVPDEVDVHYDPASPDQAFLHTHRPRLGWVLVVGGTLGALVSVAALVAALA